MVFVPFTGVNHHRQSITFGAGFLANEKIESYIYGCLKSFLEAMFYSFHFLTCSIPARHYLFFIPEQFAFDHEK